MRNISLIAAMDENRGLGKENKLLCHLPADLNYFKTMTMGKPIIMGRKTFESIGKPLPGRQNIVLSTTLKSVGNVIVASSLAQALSLTSLASEVMIIGGAKLYQQSLAYANKIYLTLIHHQFEADVYFPKLDDNLWRCVSEVHRPSDSSNPYDLTFYYYSVCSATYISCIY